MNRNARAVIVQACHNSRANSSGGAGDENYFVVERLIGHGFIHKDFIAYMQYETHATLPQADALSAEHSVRVSHYLQQKIADADGQLSFAEFMHEALYAPGLGYYSAGATKFGGDGDFTTAPEISPLFGRIVARQCSEVLGNVDSGEVLEFGAGSGRLAADMLVAFESLGCMPPVYNILEVSPDLQARQRHCLDQEVPHLLSRVRWLSGFPDRFSGVVVAN